MYCVTGLWWLEISLSRPPCPWEDKGNVPWDDNLSTSMGQATLWGGNWLQVEFGGCFVFCCPTKLMGFIPLGSPVGLALCPTINCINSKGYLSILHRQQEMMVPNLGCGGGGGISQRALFVFVHFPDCVAENTLLLCPH